jgi:hypothetical protein
MWKDTVYATMYDTYVISIDCDVKISKHLPQALDSSHQKTSLSYLWHIPIAKFIAARNVKYHYMEEPAIKQKEDEYIKVQNDECRRMIMIREFEKLLTGKDSADFGRIISETPKGFDWRRRLTDESRDHMFILARQMTDSDIDKNLNDMRTICCLVERFSDVLYEELERREKQKSILSI